MSKFQIGDRVRLDRNGARNFTLKADITATVSALIGAGIRVKVPADHRDKFCIENHTYPSEVFSLVLDPDPPLFRKGDKVLVEYEVLADEPTRAPGADRHVKVTAPGCTAKDGVTRIAEFLAAGSITRAPEPPYVPKPGDKFKFGSPSGNVMMCIFVDDKSMMYENTGTGYRYVCTPSLYTFNRFT